MIRQIRIFLFITFVAANSVAHEGRPIYIEVLQAGDGMHTLKWKIPPVMADGWEPLIRLEGEGCEISAGNSERRLSGALSYRCGNSQTPFDLVLDYPGANPVLSVLLVFTPASGIQQQSFTGPDVTRIKLGEQASFSRLASQYLWAGISHLLAGYDHLLFVICLMWISQTPRRLFLTVTGFTVGHSFTLALASTGYIWVPVVFVEVLIALSIAILAAEIVKNNRSTLAWRHPVGLAVLFGLLHGFGFASVLADFGLPQGMMMVALVFFNVGIELGQLMFVTGCWLLFHWLLKPLPNFDNWQGATSKLTLYAIGTLSSYWVAERYIGLL